MKTKKLPAKACYTHIGGTLGNLLMSMFIDKGWIRASELQPKYFYITDKGHKEFEKLGLDLSSIKEEEL